MSAIKCPKCGNEISSDFEPTLFFCANCGAGLKNPQTGQPPELSEADSAGPQKPIRLLPAIILTSFFTALFLIVLFAAGLYFYFPPRASETSESNPSKTSSPDKTASRPTPRQKSVSSLSVSEITDIELSEIRYGSSVKYFQSQANRIINNMTITSNQIRFSADGTASKVSNKVEYDAAGRQKPEQTTKYKGAISREQFIRLAQVAVENDFLHEEDSKEIISDSNIYTLKIIYTGGEKRIAASNIDKDTPEVAAILQAFRNLRNQTDWKEER
jgi:transcription initiation factor TFIIIB Brf1 subunit/transcription initiation factor TFIIB